MKKLASFFSLSFLVISFLSTPLYSTGRSDAGEKHSAHMNRPPMSRTLSEREEVRGIRNQALSNMQSQIAANNCSKRWWRGVSVAAEVMAFLSSTAACFVVGGNWSSNHTVIEQTTFVLTLATSTFTIINGKARAAVVKYDKELAAQLKALGESYKDERLLMMSADLNREALSYEATAKKKEVHHQTSKEATRPLNAESKRDEELREMEEGRGRMQRLEENGTDAALPIDAMKATSLTICRPDSVPDVCALDDGYELALMNPAAANTPLHPSTPPLTVIGTRMQREEEAVSSPPTPRAPRPPPFISDTSSSTT